MSCGRDRDRFPAESDGGPIDLSDLRVSRTIAPRLSIAVRHRQCVEQPGRLVSTAACSDSTTISNSADVLRFTARASKAVQERVDAGTLRAAALADLIWHDSAGISLGRSIKYLQTAARLDARSVEVLVDLSAAYIVRAERTQSPRDLLEAMETASRALELQASNEAALFNIALAEERLGLTGEARRDWDTYARLDSRSGWGAEARTRSRELAALPAARTAPRADAPTAELVAFADVDPQAASLFGWRDLLGEWGSAAEAGDSARAAARLGAAAAIGDALALRSRDATLSDAVRAIRDRVADRQAQAVLARSHRELAAGMATYDSGHFQAAEAFFDRSLAGGPPSASLVAWASVFRGLTLMLAGKTDSAEHVLLDVAVRSDSLRYPSLVGRARWGLGTAYLRRGRYESALEAYRAAAASHARAGDNEHLAALHALAAQAEFAVGDPQEGFGSLRRSLAALRAAGEPPRLHNVLYALQRATAAEGLLRAALVVCEEDVAVTARSHSPLNLVEARIARARRRDGLGLTSEAAADRDSVRQALPQLVPDARRWFTAHLQQVTAEADLRAHPDDAIAALDSAARYFEERGNMLRLLPTVVTRAEARLLRADIAGAEADLARATVLLAAQRDSIGRADYRVSMIEGARRVFDRLVLLRIAAGKSLDALAYLERGRVTLSPAGALRPGATSEPVSFLAPPGTAVLDYALVGDTLLTWVVRDTSVEFSRREVSRDSLAQTVRRVRSALELGAGGGRVAADLVRLNDWLVRPVAGLLGDSTTTLAVVADGEIAGVPFAALRDSSGTHLIELHPIRFANSFRDAVAAPAARGTPEVVALVANPDANDMNGLAPLPEAAGEVRRIAGLYDSARVQVRTRATRSDLVAALGQADVLHFAGHAVFDADRPERSYVVLAPDTSGSAKPGRLTAREIADADLRGMRLVVLSACETLPARRGRSGGVSGLAAAMLAGGARGVVGTDWRVDDRIARDLTVAFHREYRVRGDGPRALRAAQLEMLRSTDGPVRSPASWAGFRYAGN